jgi:hypothetical protein
MACKKQKGSLLNTKSSDRGTPDSKKSKSNNSKIISKTKCCLYHGDNCSQEMTKFYQGVSMSAPNSFKTWSHKDKFEKKNEEGKGSSFQRARKYHPPTQSRVLGWFPLGT